MIFPLTGSGRRWLWERLAVIVWRRLSLPGRVLVRPTLRELIRPLVRVVLEVSDAFLPSLAQVVRGSDLTFKSFGKLRAETCGNVRKRAATWSDGSAHESPPTVPAQLDPPCRGSATALAPHFSISSDASSSTPPRKSRARPATARAPPCAASVFSRTR